MRLPCWLLDELAQRARAVGVTLPLYLTDKLAPSSRGHATVAGGLLPPCSPTRPDTLRSGSWCGPQPSEGDVVQHPDGHLDVVRSVAQGPGIGQYRLDVAPATVIRWTPT